jgi:hypothetical protein
VNGFSLEALPTTIRDAVSLTRYLGFRYLWVDALCIIQDDGKDWAMQSACMDQIYALAAITIAASASQDKWDGISTPRAPQKGVPVTSPCSTGPGPAGIMFFSQRAGLIRDIVDKSPLASRAWTLQEQNLSRRIIHFARDQIYWECQQGFLAEDGLTLEKTGTTNNFLAPAGRISMTTTPTWFWMVTRWRWVVENYAQRSLFASSDKLPALAGLANQFQQLTGATYLAGLWHEELPLGLLWTIKTTDDNETGHSVTEWRAPSWSWASIEGAIHYGGYADFVTITTAEKPTEQLEILAAEISPKEEASPLGEITKAVLRVRGKVQRVARALAKPRSAKWSDRTRLGYIVRNTGEVMFDNEMVEGVVLPVEFLCLLVDRRKDEQSDNYFCTFLAIEEDADSGYFRRIGAGYVEGLSWFSSCDPVILNLV